MEYNLQLSKEDNHKVEEPQVNLKFSEDSNESSTDVLRMLSLFSGCGGMDLGFEGGFDVLRRSVNEKLTPNFIDNQLDNGFVRLKKTKFKTVFANDILPAARNTWVTNFTKKGHSNDTYYTSSIVDLVKMHKEGLQVFPENIDIVTGGFPCQDFSISGKRKGFDSHKNHLGVKEANTPSVETRGQLYIWMKEVVEITKPKVFVAENVKGLVNLSNVKDIIQRDFSEAGDNGYLVLNPMVLHAADYGVPQNRERVFFIGIRKDALNKKALENLVKNEIEDKYNPYPKPTHAYTVKEDHLESFVQLKEVFEILGEPHETEDLSHKHYSRAKFMGKHCQGQREVNLNGISPTIRAEHHGNIEFRRLSKENGGIYTEELKRGLLERRLTLRECGMIQTFPKDFEFVIPKNSDKRGTFLVSPSKAYKVIGNAVPPLLAYNLAKRLEDVWDLYFKK